MALQCHPINSKRYFIMSSVEIVRNMDGTYSLMIYGREVIRGTRQDCENYAQFEGGDVFIPPRE